MPGALKRLRDRKLVQWSLAYLAAAWVLLEAFGFVADRFGWPASLVRGATIVLAAGFLLVLVLAWYHGERGRQRVGGTEAVLVASIMAATVLLVRFLAPAAVPGTGTDGPAIAPAATRFPLLLPDGLTLKAMEPAVAITHDGSRLVYAAGRGDTTRLYVRELDSFDTRALEGTEGARAPFFSPDGEWIGFFADRAVKKVSLRGGTPQTLVEGAWTARWDAILSGRWESDDRLFLSYPADELGSGIWQTTATGDTPQRMTDHPWEENHFLPEVLPGGTHLLVSSWDGGGGTRVLTVSMETGEERVLIEPGTNAHFAETGQILYQFGGDIYAIDFDPETLETSGPAVPVVEDVLTGERETVQFAVSQTGTLVYVPAGVDSIERSLVWVDATGATEPVPDSRTDAYTPRIAPADGRIAFQRRPANDLWLLDTERGMQGPIAGLGATTAFWHLWTPDGRGIVFNADLDGSGWIKLHEVRVDGTGSIRTLTSMEAHQQPQAWSPDGELLVFTAGPNPETAVDIWTVRVPRDWTAETDRTPHPFLRTAASEFHPSLSPVGAWMAYVSDVSGQWEVYVTSFPDPGPIVRVSTAGGSEPTWSPDGQTLYFRSLGAWNMAREMMASSVLPADPVDGSFRADAPTVLFDGPYFQCSEWGRSYDLSPEGDRFLMVYDQRPDLTATQINVVVNWFAELRAR